MLYRHNDGSYTWSSPSGEESKDLTRQEGDDYLRTMPLNAKTSAKHFPGMTDKQIRKKLLAGGEGFVVT